MSITWLDQGAVRVSFENESTERKVFLSPLDGSFDSTFQPHYIFTVKDSKGREIPFQYTDIPAGTWAETTWPDDYLITVEAGETEYILIVVSQLQNQVEGKYRINLRYEYDRDETKPTKGVLHYPVEVWEGTLRSKTIRVEVRNEEY